MSTFITIIIYLATAALLLDAVLLILLVLIQLPKKEAGAGVAFGGGATDALFGAGSGNALTNITKYVVVAFFVLSLSLTVLQNHSIQTKRNAFSEALEAKTGQPKPAPANPAAQNKLLTAPMVAAPATNVAMKAPATNAPVKVQPTPPPAAPASNPAAPAKK